jgi:hypothetical protein
VADIVNIPLPDPQLYFLKLVPQDRTAMFRYAVEDGVWLIIECHESTGVISVEENREREGGWMQVTPKAPSIDRKLTTEAERVTKAQLALWDTASAGERLSLRAAWADDTMYFVEHQLQRALQRPREGEPRYNYMALAQLTQVLCELEAEHLAFKEAIRCLG